MSDFFYSLFRNLSVPYGAAIWKGIRLAKSFQVSRKGLTAVGLSLLLASCNQQPPARRLPPPEVTVSKPEEREVVNWNEFTGRTAAVKPEKARATSRIFRSARRSSRSMASAVTRGEQR